MSSFRYKFFLYFIKKQSVKAIFQKTGEELEKEIKANFREGRIMEIPKKFYKKYTVSSKKVLDNPVYKIKGKGRLSGKKIIYIHGGGYVMDASEFQINFAAKIMEATDSVLYIPQYPLAPENSGEKAMDMIFTIYKGMLKKTDPKDIVILGDSAGGGISLSLAMYIRENNLPQPGNIILISPSVQIVYKSKEDAEIMKYLEEKDPVISMDSGETICDWWRGSLEPTDYRVQPIYGSLKGLGPITMFSSTADVLNLGVRNLMKKAKEENVTIDYYEKPDLVHCWVEFDVPEAKEERRIIIEKINK